MSAFLEHEVAGASVWKGEQMRARRDWIYPLTQTEVAEIDSALAKAKSGGLALFDVGAGDFPLPTLAPRLAAIREEVAEGRDQHGHGDPEDHDGAMLRDGRVVLHGRYAAEERHGHVRERELHPEHIGVKTTEQRHEHASKQILFTDVLVVRRENVLLHEAHLVVVVAVGAVGVVVSDGHQFAFGVLALIQAA